MKKISSKELQVLQLAILDELLSFCNRAGIRVFLCGGTLLGAARHSGYIPWDDDIDVMLLREDYERLLSSFPAHPYLELRTFRNTLNYPFAFASLCDVRTIKIERKLRRKFTVPLCVNIDIFPVDACPSDDFAQTVCYRQVSSFGNALKCATYRFGAGKGVFSTMRKNLGIFVYRVKELLGLTSVETILRDWNRFCLSAGNTGTDHIGILAIDHYGEREINRLADYSSVATLEFEGRRCTVPCGYLNYLQKLYGRNCLDIPPPEKRVTHHESDCYWRDGFESATIENRPCAER